MEGGHSGRQQGEYMSLLTIQGVALSVPVGYKDLGRNSSDGLEHGSISGHGCPETC